LLGPGHCFREQILNACPDCSASGHLQESLAGGSLETIRQMVASGLIKMIPFTPPAPSRTVALAWRKGFTRPEVIEVLREEILQCSLNGVTLL